MPRTICRRFLLPLLTAALAACGDSTGTGGNNAPNAIDLQSDAGDLVGGGKSYSYTQANALIGVGVSGGVSVPITLTVNVLGDESWTGFFSMPAGKTRVETGTYQQGLNWHGRSACGTPTGPFTITRVSYDDSARVTAVDLTFEQRCSGATAALRGTIHWRLGDPTKPPGPVNPIPTNLWQPAAGATPTGTNFVYLESETGDYVGQGQTYSYTPANATLTVVVADVSHIFVGVSATENWSGDFLSMSSLPKLAVGYYPGLERYPFVNPTKGGLDWFGQGRGCTALSGWFAIDHITWVADSLTALDLRFEQHCEAGATALHGAIHWTP